MKQTNKQKDMLKTCTNNNEEIYINVQKQNYSIKIKTCKNMFVIVTVN